MWLMDKRVFKYCRRDYKNLGMKNSAFKRPLSLFRLCRVKVIKEDPFNGPLTLELTSRMLYLLLKPPSGIPFVFSEKDKRIGRFSPF